MEANLKILRQYFPLGGDYPPALTIGLTIFLPFLYILNFFISINDHIALSPTDLFKLDLNRVSLYPLGHLSIFHVLMNVLALITPLSNFERRHGTVYTGVVLNLLAVSTAIPYCILGSVFIPNTKIIGASAWAFSFAGYFAYKESLIKPTFQITPSHSLPTLATPLIPLILIAIFVPGSSFFGHLFGLISGYALAYGYLAKLAPPSKVIEFIESKLDGLINLIPSMFIYYREVEAKHSREQTDYVSLIGPTETILPTTNNPTAPASNPTFAGQGHVLGA